MTSHARRRNFVAALLAGTVALSMTACGGSGGADADADTMTPTYSQVVADQLPLWIADESGLFTAQGLNVTLTNLSGSDGFPALVSGQTQLASIGGSEMVPGRRPGSR